MRDPASVGDPGEELAQSLLDSLDHGLLLVDADGRVLSANTLGRKLVSDPASAARVSAFCRETASHASKHS